MKIQAAVFNQLTQLKKSKVIRFVRLITSLNGVVFFEKVKKKKIIIIISRP